MRTLEFYIIKDEDILLSKNFTDSDIVFILDGKVGYIWKGSKAINLDEITAKKIDSLIKEKFDEINFVLIPDIEIRDDDNPKFIELKREIKKRLVKETKYVKKKNKFIDKIKNSIREFKNYENSWKWRKKLSNLTTLWKLAILNIIIIGFSIVFIYNQAILNLSIGDFILLFVFLMLFIIFIINLIFVIFPMKFPVKVLSIGKGYFLKEEKEISRIEKIKGKEMPQKPKIPADLKGEIPIPEIKKPQLQIQIEPLKSKKKIKKESKTKIIVNGEEYQSEEDLALGVPSIPEAPKKMEKITIDSPGLSTAILDKVKELKNPKTEVVLVNCERCKSVIPVPVPKDIILKSELPVVPFSYVHKNPDNKDEHCITLHIDHDFDIRRQRISDVVISK